MSRIIKRVTSILAPFIIACIIISGTVVFLSHSAWRVSGRSMQPTYYSGDLLITTPVKANSLSKGSIIILDKPSSWVLESDDTTDKEIVKRVIATTGDTVTLKDNGQLAVNGKIIDSKESTVDLPSCRVDNSNTANDTMNRTVTIPKDSVMVRGDNVNHSYDSRWAWCHGENPIIPVTHVKAQVNKVIPFGSIMTKLNGKGMNTIN